MYYFKCIAVLVLCCFLQFGKGCKRNSSKYIDLSYSFSKDTVFFPGQKSFTLNKDYDGVNKSGFWYSAFSFTMGEHGGTHLDAPFHFNPEGWTLDKIPEDHLIDVPARVVNVESDVLSFSTGGETFTPTEPRSFELQVEHLMHHEKVYGKLPAGGVVLVFTGFSKFWPDRKQYLGWTNEGNEAAPNLNFPGISKQAAKWLADERQILGVGIDTASVDPGSSTTFPAHIVLAEKQVYNIENVANLHTLLGPSYGVGCDLHLFVLPIKIIGGTGGPARILAYCK